MRLSPYLRAPRRHASGDPKRRQRGQTIILVVLALGIFMIGFVGFATDLTNLWFRRQNAQSAADAACMAAASDLLLVANGGSAPSYTIGTAFDCTSGSTHTPCYYANLNGFDSAGLSAGAESNIVSVSFPGSVTGVGGLPSAYSAFTQFVRVSITARSRTFFLPLITASKTQDVKGAAVCGMVTSTAPIPLIVLHPTSGSSLDASGTPSITIAGGPKKSIQVNSSSATALSLGGTATINLATAGPSGTGADFGTFGGPTTKPSGLTLGTGTYNYPATPVGDPLASISFPTQPGAAPAVTTVGTDATGGAGAQGCPAPVASGCKRYQAGYYSAGIEVKNEVAIFDPGLYYIGTSGANKGLTLAANSLVRPSSNSGDGSGGVIFYFTGSSSLNIGSNSGSVTATAYTTAGVSGIPGVACPGGAAAPLSLPATLSGNVFLAPCTGTYGDPLNQYRGVLFFQNRGVPAAATWSGGGGLLTVGIMYFHHCRTDGLGANCTAPATNSSCNSGGTVGTGGYGALLSMQGGSSGNSYAIGNIITDKICLGGNSSIQMVLNPSASFALVKAQLLQ